jgi:hypothetical protein
MHGRETLNYIVNKFGLNLSSLMPLMIPNTDRVTLAELFRELGYKEGAEIGVREGEYSKILCEKNPGVKLHCVDPWEGYPGYRDIEAENFSTIEQTARRILASYDCNFIKKYSMDALKDIPDRSLDFVYIDANHDIRHVIDDVSDWANKVKKGGIVAGHDYVIAPPRSRAHVLYAMQAFTLSWGINPWFILGREERIPGERRERNRSWFFIV